ncbi:MAG: TonB-dependent receptor [Chitinophagaceae bacterium]
MKLFLLSIIGFLIGYCLHAQTIINGKVQSTKGQPLAFAGISIQNAYDGTVADSAGNFSFKTFEKGKQVLQVKLVNYKTAELPIELNGTTIQLTISLREQVNELMAVTVSAGTFEASDRKKAATVLSPIDMYTTAGANADVTAAIKTLPGAQQIGEQEGLFVRGGAGYETKQIIDGTIVNNPFFASVPDIAQRGRFAPNLFKGNVFSTGGYSALYGQALSSVLLLESIDMPNRSEANASISSVFIGGGLQQLTKNKKWSYGANYGYTNLALYFSLVNQDPDYFTKPSIHTADANVRFKTKNGIVKMYSSFGSTRLGLRRPNIDDKTLKNAFSLNNINWYNNISWRESLGAGWKMNAGFSFSIDDNNIVQQIQNQQNKPITTGINYIDQANFNINAISSLTQLRAVFDKKISGISVLRFGAEHWYAHNKSAFNSFQSTIPNHLTAVFSEADLSITNQIAAKIGGRFEYVSYLKKANLAPRLSLAYKTGANAQVSLAYGMFYQNPENNQFFAALSQPNTQFNFTKATHYVANYIKTANQITFRVEAFYKQYQQLVTNTPQWANNGSGYAKGIELFYRDKKTIKGLDYWISYSFLDTKRQFLNYPIQLQPSFAAKHTLNIVAKKFFTNINTGFNITYATASGRPYYNIQTNANQKPEIVEQGTTIPFHSLGFSANKLTKVGKKGFGVLVVSITNVLGNKQIFGYNFAQNGSKQAIIPPAPRFFFIGYFLSWGVDRSQDAINNNL